MAAAVAIPLSSINQNNSGVLPPSAVSYKAPRHGRSRGVSINKAKPGPRPRGYSVADEREAGVAQALVFVLNRAQNGAKGGNAESGSDDETLVTDAEGWVSLDEVLEHPKAAGLGISTAEVQSVVASAAAKGRLVLRKISSDVDLPADDAASYEIRRAPKAASKTAPVMPASVLTDVSPDTADLPEFIVFETSYPKYHLILTSGSIKKAGGQPYLSFVPGSETTESDVTIWIHLQTAMAAVPSITWKQTESGAFLTMDEIPTKLWKKAVARRGDLGVLFEDGQIRKEVPVGLRGKGAKARKGKGVLKNKEDREDDGSSSASE